MELARRHAQTSLGCPPITAHDRIATLKTIALTRARSIHVDRSKWQWQETYDDPDTCCNECAGDKRKAPSESFRGRWNQDPLSCINLNVVKMCELRVGCNRNPIGLLQIGEVSSFQGFVGRLSRGYHPEYLMAPPR